MDLVRGWRGPETPDPSLSAPHHALISPSRSLSRLVSHAAIPMPSWLLGGSPPLTAAHNQALAPHSSIPATLWGPRAPLDSLGLLPARSTSPEQREAPQVPPPRACTLSISHSGRQVLGLCSCIVLHVGAEGKHQAQLGIIMCTEEV